MDSDDRKFLFVVMGVALVLIALCFTCVYFGYQTKVSAFANGYEQVTVQGYNSPVWVKSCNK